MPIPSISKPTRPIQTNRQQASAKPVVPAQPPQQSQEEILVNFVTNMVKGIEHSTGRTVQGLSYTGTNFNIGIQFVVLPDGATYTPIGGDKKKDKEKDKESK